MAMDMVRYTGMVYRLLLGKGVPLNRSIILIDFPAVKYFLIPVSEAIGDEVITMRGSF